MRRWRANSRLSGVRKLKEAKGTDAIGGWLKQEHLRDEAAKIERVRVLVLEG